MFGLFKRNKHSQTFSVLGTDMHCHLLPGVDDGSRDVKETVECLKAMAQVGFKKIYLTPHFQANYPNDEEDIQARFKQLKKALEHYADQELPEIAGISGEYRFDPRFERKPGVDNVMPLPGKILLCELSLHASDYKPISIFEEYLKLGYKLILAHPERYPYLGPHSPELTRMKELGMFFQVNILSLNGFYGEAPRKKGFEYINNGWVEYLGTDTHNTRYSSQLLATAENREVQKMLEKHSFLNSEM